MNPIYQDHQRLQATLTRATLRLEQIGTFRKLRASEEWQAVRKEIEAIAAKKAASLVDDDHDLEAYKELQAEIRMLKVVLGLRDASDEEVDLLKRQVAHLREVLKKRQDQNFHLDLGRPKVQVAEEGVPT